MDWLPAWIGVLPLSYQGTCVRRGLSLLVLLNLQEGM
jgi:hypothetical protein